MSRSTLIKYLLVGVFVVAFVCALTFLETLKNTLYPSKVSLSKEPIKAIVQTGPQKEALKTTYIAELLNLSVDRPTLSHRFNLVKAEKMLLSSPVIASAEVKLMEPGIVYVDYTTRQPIAFLQDFENTALDTSKTPFPLFPFFSPKKLPEIYLGVKGSIKWNVPIVGKKIDLAYALLKILDGPMTCDLFTLERVDVSKAFANSLGEREIVVMAMDRLYGNVEDREITYCLPRILRLSTKDYVQELGNYLRVREQLLVKERETFFADDAEGKLVYGPTKIIDCRIPQLAFIDEL